MTAIGCSQTPPRPVQPQPAPPPPPDATIELERTPCYGTCPVYTVTIDGDGTVRWKGQWHVAALGDRTTRIPPFEVQYLLDRFQAMDFDRLEPSYAVAVTDLPTEILRLRVGTASKEVMNYALGGRMTFGATPIEHWQIQDELLALGVAIDSVLDLDRWIDWDEAIEPRPSNPVGLPFGLTAKTLPAARIELESVGDELESPRYLLVLGGDGGIEWKGDQFVRETGDRTAVVPAEEVSWLLGRFERAGFFDMKDRRTEGSASCCTTVLRIRLPDRTHEVTFELREPAPDPRTDPDPEYRAERETAALASLVRVVGRADFWIGGWWDSHKIDWGPDAEEAEKTESR